MSLLGLLRTPCVVVRRAVDVADEYGDPTQAETLEDAVCDLQASDTGEEDLEQAETSTFRVWFPATLTPPRGGDALDVDGVRYEFTGDAMPWTRQGSSAVQHVEAQVRRVA